MTFYSRILNSIKTFTDILGNLSLRISDPWEKNAPGKISEILL